MFELKLAMLFHLRIDKFLLFTLKKWGFRACPTYGNYIKMNKCIILVASLFLASLLHGQSDEVTLTVMGQGKTIEEAQQQAFRDAIMQTYGVFVSSNTEVANDELKADTVNTITSGSVKKYDVISKTDLPDGSMALALRVVVSTQALGSFFESSGGSAKIAGGLFAFKIKQQQLNERNEVAAVKNMIVAL